MSATYLAAVNTIIDCKTLRIAMFVNLTKKILKIIKGIQLSIIHKCVNAVYIIIDISKAFTILTTIAIVASATHPFIFI